MALFQWDDAYLIGVDELDFEHKDLFARLNELHEDLVRHEEPVGAASSRNASTRKPHGAWQSFLVWERLQPRTVGFAGCSIRG
ncbi:MAG: hypothetical protein O7G84_12035 [Gammaproteobacteria bacterium]|jgi:hypothetical protein|nr:hypothetical protein [Gammaproteobacteria bacterium]